MLRTSDITLARKVGMLLMAPLHEDRLDDLVVRFGCGSLLTWSGAFGDTSPEDIDAFCGLLNRAQTLSLEHRGVPLWLHGMPPKVIAGREEGWLGRAAGASVDPARVERAAELVGRRWRALGVHNIPEPTLNVPLFDTGILMQSATSSDPEEVRVYGTAFNRGVLAGRCGTMPQHFPAHGATPDDSHKGFPVVDLPMEELRRDHLQPYQECFDDGCTTICTAHLTCNALDSGHMATISKRVLTDFLKGKMGFKGVVIADAIEMDGFKKVGPLESTVVAAVNAGCDSICMVDIQSVEPVYNALLEAAESGRIPVERLDDAVQRQLNFMQWLGLERCAENDPIHAGRQLAELDDDPDAELLL